MQRLQKKRKEFLPTHLHLVRNFLLIYRTSSTLRKFLAFLALDFPQLLHSPGNRLKFHIEYWYIHHDIYLYKLIVLDGIVVFKLDCKPWRRDCSLYQQMGGVQEKKLIPVKDCNDEWKFEIQKVEWNAYSVCA